MYIYIYIYRLPMVPHVAQYDASIHLGSLLFATKFPIRFSSMCSVNGYVVDMAMLQPETFQLLSVLSFGCPMDEGKHHTVVKRTPL